MLRDLFRATMEKALDLPSVSERFWRSLARATSGVAAS